MTRTLLILAALALTAGQASAFETVATLTGPARAKDGDGVLLWNIEIRLNGIAAPEDNRENVQPGGPEATAYLGDLIHGRTVACRLDGTSTRGRPVGRCFLEGRDLGELMVLNGHARDCPAYSGGDYAEAEALAQASGTDLSAIYELPPYCIG